MSEYQLVTNFDGVKRTLDSAMIPDDGGNRDWQEYQAWLGEGNTPDPAEPVPVPPPPPPDPNARLDTGVEDATAAYKQLTPGGSGELSVEERLIRLEVKLPKPVDTPLAMPMPITAPRRRSRRSAALPRTAPSPPRPSCDAR